MTGPRSRWKAVVLSLFFPGLGHLYAGRPRLAILRFAACLAASITALTLFHLFPFGAASYPTGLLLGLGALVWVAVDAGRVAALAPHDYALQAYNRWYVYLAVILAGAAVSELGFLSQIEAYRIPSGAMEPTALIDDFIYARKTKAARQDVTIGSLVIFESVEEPGFTALKRVVGMPGDTISMLAGNLILNGEPVTETYVAPPQDPADVDPEDPKMRAWQARYLLSSHDSRPYRPTLKNWGPLVVPPESVFVLGDNRDRSYDSRYYGFVGTDRIEGQAHFIYYSYDPDGMLPLPFLTAIRWNRIGVRLSSSADPPNTR